MNGTRTALVLGGTSGIGLGVARHFNAVGISTIIAGRQQERTEEIAATISSQCEAITVDLASAPSYESLHSVLNMPIDILVVNGPGYAPDSILHVTREDFQAGFDLMFLSLVSVINQILPGMRDRAWGRIIYVSSSSVVVPIPELAVSSVIRNAMHSYLKILATEVAIDGITVNSVLPGRITTPRVEYLDSVKAEQLHSTSQEISKNAQKLIPIKRYGTPEEIGSLIAYLASEQASYITGSSLRCDGGAILSL